jgi:hypothetical protein
MGSGENPGRSNQCPATNVLLLTIFNQLKTNQPWPLSSRRRWMTTNHSLDSTPPMSTLKPFGIVSLVFVTSTFDYEGISQNKFAIRVGKKICFYDLGERTNHNP